MKKSICVIISAFILISMISVPGLSNDYSGHWAEEAINLLIKDDIISGDETGNINPDRYITRAEFSKIINKKFNYKHKAETNFPDVNKDMWYYDDFLIAKEYEYITGDDNGFVYPENDITRTETCIVLARTLDLAINDQTTSYSDDDEIPDWGKCYVSALQNTGYFSGYPDGSFRGNNKITRGEAFTVISKYLKKFGENSENIGNTVQVDKNHSNNGL